MSAGRPNGPASWHLYDWIWRQRGLAPRDKFVELALAYHFNQDFQACWPGQERLCEVTGYGETSVRKALQSLEKLGIISRDARWRSEHRRTSDLTRFPNLPADIAARLDSWFASSEFTNPAEAWLTTEPICPKPKRDLPAEIAGEPYSISKDKNGYPVDTAGSSEDPAAVREQIAESLRDADQRQENG